MSRLRIVVTLEYDAPSPAAYGTDVPAEMARIDQEQFSDDPFYLLEMISDGLDDGSTSLTVEPVE